MAAAARGGELSFALKLYRSDPGRVVQVDPIKLKLKPPETKRSKLKCDAFNF
jgi:hypothetical protein